MGTLWSFCLPTSSSQCSMQFHMGRGIWFGIAGKFIGLLMPQSCSPQIQLKQAGELRLCSQMHVHDKKTASTDVVWNL